MLIIIHLFIAPFGPFSPILPAIFLRLVIATIILPISIQACSSVRIPYFSRLFSLFYLCSIIFIASKWASVCLMCSYGMLSHFHRFLDRFRCFGGSIRFMSCIRFVAFLCSVGFEHWFLFCRVGLISLFFILCMDSCWFFGYIRVGGKRRAAAASQADKLFIQAISFIRRPEIAKYIAHAYNNNNYYIHETRVLRVYAKKLWKAIWMPLSWWLSPMEQLHPLCVRGRFKYLNCVAFVAKGGIEKSRLCRA